MSEYSRRYSSTTPTVGINGGAGRTGIGRADGLNQGFEGVNMLIHQSQRSEVSYQV